MNDKDEYALIPDLPDSAENPLRLLTPLNPDRPLNADIPLVPE
jgi:hypothetical protein